MIVRFLQRGLSFVEQTLPAGLTVEVDHYTKTVYGGCEKAELTISGKQDQLLELINYLRNGVEIYDDHGNAVWWGFVNRVEIPREKVIISADLEEMHNKVAVAYNLLTAGGNTVGIRRTSPWISDDDSVAKFGTKELLESGGSMNAVEAVAMATRLRNERGFPRVFTTSGSDDEAKIECLGWWQTLAWRYVSVPTELALSFQTIGGASVKLLEGVRVAQSFLATSDINLAELEIHICKVGGAGGVNVKLTEADENGLPGDDLRSATINAYDITTTPEWVRAAFSESLILTPGKTYYLTFASAWSTETNYQVITLDPNHGYGGGVFCEFDTETSTWTQTSKDMPFRLYNNALTETSQQLQNILTDAGQFFGAIHVDDRSGLYAESYRNGDTTALTEAEDFLEIGTANNRRLLARVNLDRTIEVWQQPEETTDPPVEMHSDGKLYYPAGSPVEDHFDPTGKWISIEPILWGAIETTTLTGKKSFFCDEVEWSERDGLKLKPANWRNPYNLRIING